VVQPLVRNFAGALAGIAIAALLVVATLLPGTLPVMVLRAGAVETVPGFENTSSRYTYSPGVCTPLPCGNAGVTAIKFTLALSARLTGSLESTEPIEVVVGSQYASTCGLFSNPPPPCAPPANPSYEYAGSALVTGVDFGDLQFDFTGPNNELPAGSWTIYLGNWNVAPSEVTVVTSVVATPY
jgi:hypothetical protein